MTEFRCDCCDLPIYSCGKAAENRQRHEIRELRNRLSRTGDWFPASFGGSCADCGGWFNHGTWISRKSDGKWRAECCAALYHVQRALRQEDPFMDYKHWITTLAEPKLCPSCGALTLEGYADGFHYWVEVDQVNRAGEVGAVLDGRATYQLEAGRLRQRDARMMAGASADDTPVLVWHCCHRPLPQSQHSTRGPDSLTARIIASRSASAAPDDQPPF